MIRLTRLNREPFYLNPDMIQEIESTPDTVLMLSSGMRIVVQEAPEQVIEQVIDYRRRILSPPAWKQTAAHEAGGDAAAESGESG